MSVCPCSCKQVRASLCMQVAPMGPKMAIFLSRMSMNTRILVQNFGPFPKVAAHVSVTRKLAQRARARSQSRLATPTHASGMCKVFIITTT